MAVFHSTAAQTIAPIAALERLEAAISRPVSSSYILGDNPKRK